MKTQNFDSYVMNLTFYLKNLTKQAKKKIKKAIFLFFLLSPADNWLLNITHSYIVENKSRQTEKGCFKQMNG